MFLHVHVRTRLRKRISMPSARMSPGSRRLVTQTFQTNHRLRWRAFDVSISQTQIISQERVARPLSMRYFDSNNRDNGIGSLNRVTNQCNRYRSLAVRSWANWSLATVLIVRQVSRKIDHVAAIPLYPAWVSMRERMIRVTQRTLSVYRSLATCYRYPIRVRFQRR